MNIKIITVGKLKEKYLKEGIAEYTKRLGSYCKLQIIEVGNEKAPETLSDKEMDIIKDKEGEKILAKIPEQSYVFAMAIQGKQYDSVEFANEIDKLGTAGKSDIVFIIGGSLGLSGRRGRRGGLGQDGGRGGAKRQNGGGRDQKTTHETPSELRGGTVPRGGAARKESLPSPDGRRWPDRAG